MTEYELECERLYNASKVVLELLERVIKRNQGGYSGDRDDIEEAVQLLKKALKQDAPE